MKKTQKILSIILVIILLCLSPIPAFANETNKDFEKINVINEYDNYISLISKSDEQLKATGMADDDIKYIRDFNYEKEIKNRAKLTDEILKLYRYSDNEIKELREAAKLDKIPENIMKSISRSTLTSSIKISQKGIITEAGQNVRYVDFEYKFSWSRIPMMLFNDTVAIAFHSDNSSEYIYKKVNSYKFTANLTTLLSGKIVTESVEWKYDGSKGGPNVSAKFPVGMKGADGIVTHMCYNGSGKFRVTNRDTNCRLFVDAVYAHTVITIAPSFSVSIKGPNIGINFKMGADEQHNTGWYYSNLTISKDYIYEGNVS